MSPKPVSLLLLIAGVLVLSACSQSPNRSNDIQQGATPLGEVALKSVQSCSALKQKFIDNWVENLLSSQRYGLDGIQVDRKSVV